MIAPAVVAGGLLASGAIPASAASQISAYSATISATSPHYPGNSHGLVDGHALVIYRTGFEHWNTAVISGEVNGAVAGDVVTLWAQPFGAKAPAATRSALTLSPSGDTPATYRFTVTPSTATKYYVQVTTGPTVDTTSPVTSVYVTEGFGKQNPDNRTTCSGEHCRTSWRVYIVLPASARPVEAAKRWYLYYALDTKLSQGKLPAAVVLTKNGSTTRARKISSTEYEVTITIRFVTKLKHPARDIFGESCTKDTESKDGMGLPGHHGCGAKKITSKQIYVG